MKLNTKNPVFDKAVATLKSFPPPLQIEDKKNCKKFLKMFADRQLASGQLLLVNRGHTIFNYYRDNSFHLFEGGEIVMVIGSKPYSNGIIVVMLNSSDILICVFLWSSKMIDHFSEIFTVIN